MNYQRNCSILTIINEITLYNSAIITYFYVYTYTQRSIHNVPNILSTASLLVFA